MAAKPKRRIDNWRDLPVVTLEAIKEHGHHLDDAAASLGLPSNDVCYHDVWWGITNAVLEYVHGYRDALTPSHSEILDRLESIRATAKKLDNLLTTKGKRSEAPSLIPSLKDVFARIPECGEARFEDVFGRDVFFSDTKIFQALESVRLIKAWADEAFGNEISDPSNPPRKQGQRVDFLRNISQAWCAAKDIEAPEIRKDRANDKAIGPFADFAEKCLIAAKAFSDDADEITSLIKSRVALYRALKRTIDDEAGNNAVE